MRQTADARETREQRQEVAQAQAVAQAEADRAAAPLVDAFAAELPFSLDPFQRESALHLAAGRSVLVAAPTGTGKTVVAEFGIWLARRTGMRAIYTAPLKALSNQKFRDLRAYYGEGLVGLMTGDIVENPTAPIVVMTTEIYRNMLLEGSRASRATAAPARQGDAAQGDGVQEEYTDGHADVDASAAAEEYVPDRAAPQPEPELHPATSAASDFARQAALDEELSSVGCVIFDELHYLSDPERGPVWEEAIIHSPAHVTLVGLSATVSNAEQLRRWIARVHGPTALVFHVERAVPLEHYFYLDGELHLVQDAQGRRVKLFPGVGGEAKLARERNRPRAFVFDGETPQPGTTSREQNAAGPGGAKQSAGAGSQERRPRRAGGDAAAAEESAGGMAAILRRQGTEAEMAPIRRQAPEPGELLTALRAAELLPCLYFLPGRRAVEVAAESAAGHLLVTPEQRARLHEEVERWVRALPAEDQRLDQVRRLAALLPRGLAFHHAGLLPGLKVMVETLFQRGDLRAVFATDTLALGINMPARSVVLGSLSKFDGVSMRLLTPNEYQQLTGRAGRRGMDAKGAAVIPYSPWDAFEAAFAELTGPLQPVNSAFSVRYNTVLNLWRPNDLTRLRLAVAACLREFQRREVEGDPADRRRRRGRGGGERDETFLSRPAMRELSATIWVLRALGYISEENDELTVRGRMLRALFHPAGMVLTELVMSGALADLGPAELAEVISWFTFDDDRSVRNMNTLSRRLIEARHEVYRALRIVQGSEYAEGIAMSPGIADDFYGVALNWWRGISLGGLVRRMDLAEGDLLVSLNQTIDLLQQLLGAVGQVLDARDLWRVPTGRRGSEAAQRRTIQETQAHLTRLRPGLNAAWRGLLRGSVAQSRAVPSMTAGGQPSVEVPEELDAVLLPMAEDEDAIDAIQDRVESDVGPEADAERDLE